MNHRSAKYARVLANRAVDKVRWVTVCVDMSAVCLSRINLSRRLLGTYVGGEYYCVSRRRSTNWLATKLNTLSGLTGRSEDAMV